MNISIASISNAESLAGARILLPAFSILKEHRGKI